MPTVLQLDDNLVNGRTYTFQFNCTNWMSNPSAETVAADIVAAAPDFITSLGVTSPFTTSLYNVQFTYEGDGSDVVSDVSNLIIAAILATSNDGMVLQGAVQAPASSITVSVANAVATTAAAIQSGANAVTTGVAQTATNTINTALMGLLPILAVAVAIILWVLPSFMKSTGTRATIG